jgi:hypothetical protein
MKRKITKRQHRAVLLESTIDNTPMEIVASLHNPDYMKMKAIELLMSAGDYHDNLRQAICLLALARCEVSNDTVKATGPDDA